jgi:hypothetical protein
LSESSRIELVRKVPETMKAAPDFHRRFVRFGRPVDPRQGGCLTAVGAKLPEASSGPLLLGEQLDIERDVQL